MLALMSTVPAPHVRFAPNSVLLVPDAPYECVGAYMVVHRNEHGQAQVICNLLMGERLEVASGHAPTHGELKAAACILSPSDARALARELETFAEEAEDE